MYHLLLVMLTVRYDDEEQMLRCSVQEKHLVLMVLLVNLVVEMIL